MSILNVTLDGCVEQEVKCTPGVPASAKINWQAQATSEVGYSHLWLEASFRELHASHLLLLSFTVTIAVKVKRAHH